MVHALTVASGLLRAHGRLVDLRTDRFASVRAQHDQLYCVARKLRIYAGPLKSKRPLADFRAADRAIDEVVRRGLFQLKTADAFELRSYFDSPADIEKYAARSRYAAVDGAVLRRLERLLRRHPRARILEVAQTRLRVLEKT